MESVKSHDVELYVLEHKIAQAELQAERELLKEELSSRLMVRLDIQSFPYWSAVVLRLKITWFRTAASRRHHYADEEHRVTRCEPQQRRCGQTDDDEDRED